MVNEEQWKICNSNNTFTVAIRARMNWDEANILCDTLGGGNITEIKDERGNEQVMSLFNGMQDKWQKVWTPLLDEEEEGSFKSDVSGKPVSYLPWNIDQPNGEQNKTALLFVWQLRSITMKIRRAIFVLHVIFSKLRNSHFLVFVKTQFLVNLPCLHHF